MRHTETFSKLFFYVIIDCFLPRSRRSHSVLTSDVMYHMSLTNQPYNCYSLFWPGWLMGQKKIPRVTTESPIWHRQFVHILTFLNGLVGDIKPGARRFPSNTGTSMSACSVSPRKLNVAENSRPRGLHKVSVLGVGEKKGGRHYPLSRTDFHQNRRCWY